MPRPKGFHMSEESRKKTSESMKGKHNSLGKHWRVKKREEECNSCKLPISRGD